jgi:hypothetical protein
MVAQMIPNHLASVRLWAELQIMALYPNVEEMRLDRIQ